MLGVAHLEMLVSPQYDSVTIAREGHMDRQIRTIVGEKGRVVIPASFREALDIKVGDEVELRIEDNELRVSTLKTRLARAQQRVRRLIKPGRLLSRELIAERREAARNE